VPQSCSEFCGEEKDTNPSRESKPVRPTSSLVTTLTELQRVLEEWMYAHIFLHYLVMSCVGRLFETVFASL